MSMVRMMVLFVVRSCRMFEMMASQFVLEGRNRAPQAILIIRAAAGPAGVIVVSVGQIVAADVPRQHLGINDVIAEVLIRLDGIQQSRRCATRERPGWLC